MAKVNVLMIGEYEKAMYHPMTDIDNLFKEKFPGITFVFSSDADELLSASNFGMIISYWDDWNMKISDEAAAALEKYVLEGGSFLVLHNGISLQLQERLRDMIGAKFLTHPTAELISYVPAEDAYTETVPTFEMIEEPYQFEMVSDNKEIFLHYIYRDDKYPAGWRKNYGQGKVVYLCPGHTISSFEVNGYMKLIENCINRLIIND